MGSKETQNKRFLSGNEAVAQGAYEAGLHVAAAYPGTPSTEIIQNIAKYKEIDSQWSINEKVAYEVAYGASVGGARSLYISKHVGVNVAMDPLMTSSYMGINGGFVVISTDDPGLHSSQNEQDNRLIAKMAKMPMLEPASPVEAKDFIKDAFEISEKFDIPVLFRMTTRVCHIKENVLCKLRKEIPLKKFEINPQKYVMVPRNAYLRHIELEKRLIKLKEFSERTKLNKIEINDTKLGFITSGVSYFYAKEMYPNASFLKLGMTYPFADEKIKEFAKKVKKIVILEELEPFIEEHVRMLGIKFLAKHSSFRIGELKPELIPLIVEGKPKKEIKKQLRKPSLCNGCGHRLVYSVLKKTGATVTGDIGCYTLGSLPPFESLHTCLCMGAGITFFEGLKRSKNDKVIGVIGDSTFIHSGITGLINAVYNNVKGLIIILDNATTAMTGGQPHPATGITLKGEKTKALSLEKICEVSGVDNVDVIDPIKVKEFEELVMKRFCEDKLSVIIARRPCMLMMSRKK